MGGIFSIKEFVRDDFIPGQGKEVLLFSKANHVTKYELNRIYHIFLIYANPTTHSINLVTLFRELKIPYSLFACVLFQLYDIHKTGEVIFLDFLVILWALLTSDDDCLAVLCYALFDVEL